MTRAADRDFPRVVASAARGEPAADPGAIVLPEAIVQETYGSLTVGYPVLANGLALGEDQAAGLPVSLPMSRHVEGAGWEAFDSGLENALVTRASVDPDGTLLLAGLDLADCETGACTWEPGGDRAAVWIGTLE